MMREMANPTAACAELVQSSIRPQFEILLANPARADARRVARTTNCGSRRSALSGQCLFYHFADPVIRNLLSADEYASFDIERLVEAHHRFFTGIDRVELARVRAQEPMR